MDKNDAIRIGVNYLNKLKESQIFFSEAWLFGSYASGNENENSDIDIAIVLEDSVSNSFDVEVQLMLLRMGDETLIEPHTFSRKDFNENTPIVKQIIEDGIRIQ